MKFLKLAAAALALFGAMSGAQAAPVLNLYNTGVDGAGNVLTPGSIDPHYQIYSNPSLNVGNYLAGYSFGSFVGSPAYHPTGFDWGLNTATRGTISFSNGAFGSFQAYTYRTTFDLSAYDASTVTINYNAYFDDNGELAINGVLVPSTVRNLLSVGAGSVSGVFTAGINTLDIVTFNQGGPGGILFEVTSVTGTKVPAPGALALLGLGLFGIGGLRRKLKTA